MTPVINRTVEQYDKNALQFFNRYQSMDFKEVHATWIRRIANVRPGQALDIGTGSGRDAIALAQRGWTVTAVDPSEGMLSLAKSSAPAKSSIHWVQDQLPGLRTLSNQYDLILASAVWQHLPEAEQQIAIETIAQLLHPKGFAVILLRDGYFTDGRESYPINIENISRWARDNMLFAEYLEYEPDLQGRDSVSWQTVILTP